MSIRQMFPGSIVKPGFNPLAAPTPSYTYDLYSWGANTYGVLGLNNTTYYSSPKQVSATTTWLSVSGSYITSYAIGVDNSLWSWGNNGYGQLGNGTSYPTPIPSSPVQVGSLTNWLKVTGRYYSVLALKTNGTIWSWAQNNNGQCGLGNTTQYSSPKQIGALTNWSDIASGNNNCLAVKTDGTLWSWGNNNLGSLGLGNTTYYSSPKQIGSLTSWLKVAATGYAHSFAIKTDGTLWSWGGGVNGQSGLGNTTNYSSPKQVGALTDWSDITGGYNHVIAIKTNGTLWSWGRNQVGQLGTGNTTYYSSPKQIGSLTTWSKSQGVYFASFAIKTDGTLWAWGQNTTTGQLGLGNKTNYSSPKQVGANTNWYSIGATQGRFTLALAY